MNGKRHLSNEGRLTPFPLYSSRFILNIVTAAIQNTSPELCHLQKFKPTHTHKCITFAKCSPMRMPGWLHIEVASGAKHIISMAECDQPRWTLTYICIMLLKILVKKNFERHAIFSLYLVG